MWFPQVAKRGLVLVTWDKGLYRKPHERALFHEHGAGGYLLASKTGASHCDQIEQLVRQWRLLKENARQYGPALLVVPTSTRPDLQIRAWSAAAEARKETPVSRRTNQSAIAGDGDEELA